MAFNVNKLELNLGTDYAIGQSRKAPTAQKPGAAHDFKLKLATRFGAEDQLQPLKEQLSKSFGRLVESPLVAGVYHVQKDQAFINPAAQNPTIV